MAGFYQHKLFAGQLKRDWYLSRGDWFRGKRNNINLGIDSQGKVDKELSECTSNYGLLSLCHILINHEPNPHSPQNHGTENLKNFVDNQGYNKACIMMCQSNCLPIMRHH